MPPPDDVVRLRHMRDAAAEALAFAQRRSRGDLDNDRMRTLALVKCIEIIGEAANRVTSPTRDATPSIPWNDIVAMRNRLIHGYYNIDLDRVWDTITADLPPLLAALDAFLESESEET